MKKPFIVVLVLLVLALPCISFAQKGDEFLSKDPILAGALSWYVPGLGQFYAGSYLKGAAFLIVEYGLLISTIVSIAEIELSISSGISLGLNITSKDDTESGARTTAIILSSSLIVVHFVNIIDAVNTTRKYNRRQESNLFADMSYDHEKKEYNLGLSGRF